MHDTRFRPYARLGPRNDWRRAHRRKIHRASGRLRRRRNQLYLDRSLVRGHQRDASEQNSEANERGRDTSGRRQHPGYQTHNRAKPARPQGTPLLGLLGWSLSGRGMLARFVSATRNRASQPESPVKKHHGRPARFAPWPSREPVSLRCEHPACRLPHVHRNRSIAFFARDDCANPEWNSRKEEAAGFSATARAIDLPLSAPGSTPRPASGRPRASLTVPSTVSLAAPTCCMAVWAAGAATSRITSRTRVFRSPIQTARLTDVRRRNLAETALRIREKRRVQVPEFPGKFSRRRSEEIYRRELLTPSAASVRPCSIARRTSSPVWRRPSLPFIRVRLLATVL